MTAWDPAQYERHKRDRDRPALDLMVQIPADLKPRTIWDLGCGTGEQAAVLAARHPHAKVWGLDSSPEMLAKARARRGVTWVEGDIAAFAPPEPPDLIYTNAALQWVGGHETLVPRLMGALAPGGVFACQVPFNYNAPPHRIMREVAAAGPWAAKLAAVSGVLEVAPPETWYDWLSPLGAVDVWTTTYLHVLTGEDPVVDWMLGTGLRPMANALSDQAEKDAFLDAYRARLREVFPRRSDGATLLPFPRLFVVARRAG
jgi:trans-aconitate 2-methyltransferase